MKVFSDRFILYYYSESKIVYVRLVIFMLNDCMKSECNKKQYGNVRDRRFIVIDFGSNFGGGINGVKFMLFFFQNYMKIFQD